MEAPVQCDCGKWFDLFDGFGSEERGTVVCGECHDKEAKEADRRGEIEQIFDHVEWGWMPVRDAQSQLRELKFQPKDHPHLADYQLAKSYRSFKKLFGHERL